MGVIRSIKYCTKSIKSALVEGRGCFGSSHVGVLVEVRLYKTECVSKCEND